MTDLASLADDGLVDALIMEIADLLGRLIDTGKAGSIDLRGLPLSSSCVEHLDQRLGSGEITVQLDCAGRSEIRETGIPGVWWTRHCDEAGRVIAQLIEVAVVPDILRADVSDMALGLKRLPTRTNRALHALARSA